MSLGLRRRLIRLLMGTGPQFAGDRDFAALAYRHILRREPSAAELEHTTQLVAARGPASVMQMLFESGEHQFRNRVAAAAEFDAGHYYSPVVDPEGLQATGFQVDRKLPGSALAGLALDDAAMLAFWDAQTPAMRAADIPARQTEGRRYWAENDVYSWGDALVLAGMLAAHRPARIIEIGSGFSSACMLDVADRTGLPTAFTFVEPYADRLKSLLGAADQRRCTLHETPVQATSPELYAALEAGDLLFIDSTHVSKTGSDVNFELFEILPRLKPGVIIHFHDIFWPFEYPDEWIFKSRRSWNELYILRAFLMDNPRFEIMFFNDYFGRRHADHARATVPRFMDNPGGGLWLRKRA
ncbi:MAG: class I SAM-dependent methyltransferase [Phenylobacterium sp.]